MRRHRSHDVVPVDAASSRRRPSTRPTSWAADGRASAPSTSWPPRRGRSSPSRCPPARVGRRRSPRWSVGGGWRAGSRSRPAASGRSTRPPLRPSSRPCSRCSSPSPARPLSTCMPGWGCSRPRSPTPWASWATSSPSSPTAGPSRRRPATSPTCPRRWCSGPASTTRSGYARPARRGPADRRARRPRTLHRSTALPDAVDLVVLDPPRTGAGRGVVDGIAALRPRAVAYVACDPAALARDTAYLARVGYAMSEVRAFDAFPMTHHLEAIACFRVGVRESPVDVWLDRSGYLDVKITRDDDARAEGAPGGQHEQLRRPRHPRGG